MTPLELIVLAIVQGVTEFLPISSSGHLILIPAINGSVDQGLELDVAVHIGSLAAVVLYFWRDSWHMARGAVRFLGGHRDEGARLAWLVILATLPVILAGLAYKVVIGDGLRSVAVVAWATLFFGILLYVADRIGRTELAVEGMRMRHAWVIGFAQILALIPGTSRSGVTMTAARFLGFDRTQAARFSMLLSIPTTAAAGTLMGYEIWNSRDVALQLDAALAAVFAFISAYIALALMMAWLKRFSMTPFVVYRLILGVALLVWAYA
ncbi:undecaprenyl-diphosphate phosphatase [Telmatospirillum sp. J64-1]|uniref:undecaprenyl-diphosphate phosphatase n=1 Tax=Telmatospirillum sp. J64-1 TaxID=2502183 RepID=UPI00115D599D|nr:undecaprenyl-diphosphate phosphatase [Telmatospirillum sp. J64-1]